MILSLWYGLALSGCANLEASVTALVDRVADAFQPQAESEADPERAAQAEAIYQEALTLARQGRPKEAAIGFRDAAELGHAAAAYALGEAYNEGRGVEQRPDLAASWFNTAAARGDARGQFIVGAAYYAGAGVKQDHGAAVGYLTKAAEQGHPRAQFLLGEAFANGRGVHKELDWAARWYGMAAMQGHRAAQFAYGVLHASGLGLPRNDVAAHAWLSLAMAGGHPAAAATRNAVARRMTPADIERAELRAARFVPRASGGPGDPPTVMYVEQRLIGLGYDVGPVDGVLGERTRAAVLTYQSTKGLAADGWISPQLLQSLRADGRRTG
ncbi:MAG: peptidoglycan-binding protein [Kiloniellales bacterium]